MAWSNNNMAHIFTNSVLVSLKQYKPVVFDAAGQIPVKKLEFWGPPGTSDDVREIQAQSLASAIDGVITQWVPNVKYEQQYGPAKTVKVIGKVLQDGTKLVADIGDAVDECFFFAGELHDG